MSRYHARNEFELTRRVVRSAYSMIEFEKRDTYVNNPVSERPHPFTYHNLGADTIAA
jgi:hypothetical protein